MCFHFFCTVQVDTIYQKVLYNSCLLLVLRHGIQKTKVVAQVKLYCDLLKKNNFCIMNKIRLV